jgi:hypothetical protein
MLQFYLELCDFFFKHAQTHTLFLPRRSIVRFKRIYGSIHPIHTIYCLHSGCVAFWGWGRNEVSLEAFQDETKSVEWVWGSGTTLENSICSPRFATTEDIVYTTTRSSL